MKRTEIGAWLKDNPLIVAVIAVCVTVGIVAAMYFELDLSWIPGIIANLTG